MRKVWRSAPHFFVVLFLAASAVALAAQPADSPATRAGTPLDSQWTIDDTVAAEHGTEFRIAPDGKWVVWVKHLPDAGKDEMVSNLVLSSLTEKQGIPLTRGPNHDANPKWSRDGRLIAFLSDRPLPKPAGKESTAEAAQEPPKMQLWLLNARGGEPWPLTKSEREVKDFDWIDGETILIVAEEDPSLYEHTLKEKKDDARAVDDATHTPPVRLFKVNLKTSEITRFTTNRDWIESVNVSPDGKWAVAIHQRSLSYEFDEKVKPATFLYDLASGKARPIPEDGKILPWVPESPPQIHWTFDSAGFYLLFRLLDPPGLSSGVRQCALLLRRDSRDGDESGPGMGKRSTRGFGGCLRCYTGRLHRAAGGGSALQAGALHAPGRPLAAGVD